MSNNTCSCNCFVDPDLSWVGAVAFLILISIALVWYFVRHPKRYIIVPPEEEVREEQNEPSV